MHINEAIRRFRIRDDGNSAVSFVVLAPMLMMVAFGFAWLGHMVDAQSIAEEAARAGARWLAVHPGDIGTAKIRAAEVIEEAMNGGYLSAGTDSVTTQEIFNRSRDTLCNDPVAGDSNLPSSPRSDGYAYCRVTYNYPVPIRKFWNLMAGGGVPLWTEENAATRPIVGEAFFLSGEMGDAP